MIDLLVPVESSNGPLLSAILRALVAVNAAETIIDDMGGGTESTYENIDRARSVLIIELVALLTLDAPDLETRP